MYIAVHFGGPILLAVALTVFLYNKYKQIKMQWRILVVAAMVLLFSLLQQFPPENLFMRFDTPEEAFRYTSSRKVWRRSRTARAAWYLRGARGRTCELVRTPKSESGWKLPTANRIQAEGSSRVNADALPDFCGSCQYTVMCYRDTNDYYLYIATYVDKGKTEFVDNRNEPVSCILTSNDYGSYVTICVPFNGYPTDYMLTVDGETVLRLE